MTEDRNSAYEGLFLFPQAQAGDLQGAVDHIQSILDRAGAELISLRKWEERRLAYEIKGNKRGVYFLAYFRARHDALIGIERDCNLSEQLLRSMMLRADLLTLEQMEAADGRAELADEIRLRSDESAAGAEKKTTDEVSRKEQTKPVEPVTVETETTPKDAAATLDR